MKLFTDIHFLLVDILIVLQFLVERMHRALQVLIDSDVHPLVILLLQLSMLCAVIHWVAVHHHWLLLLEGGKEGALCGDCGRRREETCLSWGDVVVVEVGLLQVLCEAGSGSRRIKGLTQRVQKSLVAQGTLALFTVRLYKFNELKRRRIIIIKLTASTSNC